MKISVVIPNYNGAELIEKNIPTVIEALNYSKEEWELIIVDDFSTDNSEEVIKKLQEKYKNKIIYQKNDKNYGFSTTVNSGARKAKGEFLLLLNSDVSPDVDFIKPLLDDLSDEEVFAVGCLDKSVEKNSIVERGRGKGEWSRGFMVHSAAEIKKGSSLWVSGGSGMFRKDLWEKFGGLNENYNPFYWEDIDLSYRALKSGYKVIFEPESVVVHEHEKGAIKSKYHQSKINKISYRNQILFVWQNADSNKLLLNLFWLPYYIIKTIIRGDANFTLAFFQSLFYIPKVLKERSKSFKSFTKSDDEVISIAK